MLKLTIIIAISLCISINSTEAQTIAIIPQSVSGIGSIQVGNSVAGKCDGLSPNYMKLTIQPSCYGANLRSGGNPLNPNEGKVELDLTISNGSSNYTSTISFPNKITWPENYGQTCKWSSTKPSSTIECDQEEKVVKYNCSFSKGNIFLNDSLDCIRLGDILSHGDLNRKLSCSFLYSWKGADFSKEDSYRLITNVANCGLRDRDEDFSSKTDVLYTSAPASTINKYAKRGKVVVTYNGINIAKQTVVKDNTNGKFIVSGKRSQVNAKFFQITKGIRMPLSQKIDASFDEFEECLQVKAAFLGMNQFCGSFYSPIMLFFDNELPHFAGTSSFPLVEGVKMIYWPEAKAPGYFLAVDETGSRQITSKKQLFGEGTDYKNGFEALMRYDSNKDGVIDSNDKMFSKLLLWQDANGNGVSEKGELFSLESLKVKSISLKYSDDKRQNFGKRAEARQEAAFIFLKDGKEQTGRAIDIWFSPNTMANKTSMVEEKK